MLNLNDYIEENGRVKREKIAMDIKYGVISERDIDSLVSDPRIRGSFIGSNYEDKKPKSQWNRQYLDELSYGVTAEGFNEEYLRYLNEVAIFINNQDSKEHSRGVFKGVVAIAIIIILIITVVSIMVSGKKKLYTDKNQTSSVNVSDAQ